MTALFYTYPKITGLFAGIAVTLLFSFYQKNDPPAFVISCDKMNVFYIGLYNPVTILSRGIPSEKVMVTSSGNGFALLKQDNTHYEARAKETGEVSITVSDGEKFSQTFRFFVKPLPDPEALLGARFRSGIMAAGEFKAQGGIAAVLNCCDNDMKCEMVEYTVHRKGNKEEGKIILNKGARFEREAQEMVDKAVSGDYYYFNDAKARCPGDKVARNLGSLTFKIK